MNIPGNPFSRVGVFSLQDLQAEFERMVDRLWHGGLSTPPLDGRDWAPAIDVVDEPDRYLIRVEVPGLTGGEVEVSVLDRTLTIKGSKPSPRKPGEERRYLRTECRFGAFQRDIELPVPVEPDGVAAHCRNGVLEIEAAKKPSARGRSVKVETSDA